MCVYVCVSGRRRRRARLKLVERWGPRGQQSRPFLSLCVKGLITENIQRRGRRGNERGTYVRSGAVESGRSHKQHTQQLHPVFHARSVFSFGSTARHRRRASLRSTVDGHATGASSHPQRNPAKQLSPATPPCRAVPSVPSAPSTGRRRPRPTTHAAGATSLFARGINAGAGWAFR